MTLFFLCMNEGIGKFEAEKWGKILMSNVLIFKKILKWFTSIKAELKNIAQSQELGHHRSWPKRIIFILFNILEFYFLGTRIQCRSRHSWDLSSGIAPAKVVVLDTLDRSER